MLNDFDELLIDFGAFRSHILTVFQRDSNAEFVQLSLLILIEFPVLEGCIIGLKLFKQAVSHFIFYY